MKEYLKRITPYLQQEPISKSELINRFRSHCDINKPENRMLLNLIYMLTFREVYRYRDEVVLL